MPMSRDVRKRRILVIEDFLGSVHSSPTENVANPAVYDRYRAEAGYLGNPRWLRDARAENGEQSGGLGG
jgi:hypothetical protein